MRKNKLSIFTLYLFFLLSFFFHLIKVDAFLDEDSWLDLYNNIDSWIYELELKYYETNITNWWAISIAERINTMAWVECIDEAITIEEFNKIASWDTVTLSDLILDECKEDNGEKTDISVMNNLFDVIIKLSNESKSNAEEKTRITYNIARLWMYSDWNTDNSPYDIIKDLEDINWIIFSITNWDETTYKWTDTTKLSDFLSSSNSSVQIWDELINVNSSDINEDSSNCSEFFCIKILYSKYEHTLFWWWKGKDKSIEWLIKNSNKHLYKYANTSLIQHQITIDNWELSIKDMKLQDIFNQNFIVISRNIPITNVDKNNAKEKEKKANSPFWHKNLLEYYYKLFWLDYNRANSMDDFNDRLPWVISINDSLWLGILNVSERYDSSSSHAKSSKEDEVYLNKLLSTKQRSDNMSWLYWLFIELESFTNSFEQYVKWVNLQVKSMAEKGSW